MRQAGLLLYRQDQKSMKPCHVELFSKLGKRAGFDFSKLVEYGRRELAEPGHELAEQGVRVLGHPHVPHCSYLAFLTQGTQSHPSCSRSSTSASPI